MIRAADLFAGAGGCSTGLLQAATHRGQARQPKATKKGEAVA